jgi:16S rRNA (guanine527-N7)-methyltransferase
MNQEFRFGEVLDATLKGICELSGGQIHHLQAHYELMLRWNQRLNLTSIRKPREIVERHYCESVLLAIYLPEEFERVVDIGSGAGFPGFPVAVVRPQAQVTLVESHQRKAVFLREASRSLSNVRVVSQRAETVREEFDWVISRAVNPNGVVSLIPRLARRIALLTGSEDAGQLSKGHIAWEAPIPLPWGEKRVLLIGECST